MAETIGQKTDRLNNKFSKSDDLVAIFNEAGISTTNHQKYIGDLAKAGDEAAIDAILSHKALADEKTKFALKKHEVFKILDKLGYIPEQYATNETVLEYVAKKGPLLLKLEELLTVVVK